MIYSSINLTYVCKPFSVMEVLQHAVTAIPVKLLRDNDS